MKLKLIISFALFLSTSAYADTCTFRPWGGYLNSKLIRIYPSPSHAGTFDRHLAFNQSSGCSEFIRVLKELESRSLCTPNWEYIALDILSDNGATAPAPGYFSPDSQRDACKAEVDRMTGKVPGVTSSQNMEVMRKRLIAVIGRDAVALMSDEAVIKALRHRK